MNSPQQRLVDGLAMLAEVKANVREAAEQKFAAAVTELEGALVGFQELERAPKAVPAPGLADVTKALEAANSSIAAQLANFGKLIDVAKEAAKPAVIAPVLPSAGI